LLIFIIIGAYSGFKIGKQDEALIKKPGPLTDKQIIKNLNINLHFKEKDYVYRESCRVLDIKSYMKIRNATVNQFVSEHADDKAMSEFSNKYGKMLSTRRFSVLVGRGAFHINSNKSVLIDVL
jgi:anaphase-promoting complex subunit 1